MKTKIIRLLSGALLVLAFIAPAVAGPKPDEAYTAIKSTSEAQKIPIGSRIALSCDNGGPITVVTVDANRDYLKGVTCAVSKRLYRFSPGGAGHTADQLVYKSDDGLTAHLMMIGKP